MAKDDYFVLVYGLLKYLYEQLKKGEKPESQKLSAEYMNIPVSYWVFVMTSMRDEGYVANIQYIQTKDGIVLSAPTDLIITPKGIEYLFENSLIQKAKRVLKEVTDFIPGY